MEARSFRNPFYVVPGPAGPPLAVLKAQRLLNAERVAKQLSVSIYKILLPSLSARQSLRDGSLYIGTPGIAYAFLRLAQMDSELLASAELSSARCRSLADQLLSETEPDSSAAPQSLLLGVAGLHLVKAVANEGCNRDDVDQCKCNKVARRYMTLLQIDRSDADIKALMTINASKSSEPAG